MYTGNDHLQIYMRPTAGLPQDKEMLGKKFPTGKILGILKIWGKSVEKSEILKGKNVDDWKKVQNTFFWLLVDYCAENFLCIKRFFLCQNKVLSIHYCNTQTPFKTLW